MVQSEVGFCCVVRKVSSHIASSVHVYEQSVRQPSESTSFMSSQSSPASTTPLPQPGGTHSAVRQTPSGTAAVAHRPAICSREVTRAVMAATYRLRQAPVSP